MICDGKIITKHWIFYGYQYTKARGYAGEIAMAWNFEKVEVTISNKHLQFIHVKIKYVGGEDWFFTPVYVSPREEGRK